MKIFSICLAKNEEDILERTIREALSWSDHIIIIDHDSSDGTATIAEQLALGEPGVIFFGTVKGEFTNGLRSLAYHRYSHLATVGDWWCRLDSDEFYLDSPVEFLRKVPRIFSSVEAVSFQFYFTKRDELSYLKAPERYRNGACVDSLKYFKANSSELRFFRHQKNIDWPGTDRWPRKKNMYLVYGRRIRLLHYQYRYPEQIARRFEIRSAIQQRGEAFEHESFERWSSSSWRSRIVDEGSLDNIDSASLSVGAVPLALRPIRKITIQSGYLILSKMLNLRNR